MALDSSRYRKMWFVSAAERLRLPPMVLAIVVGSLMVALTPLVERFAGPIDYVRKGFEPFVPYWMATSLVLFVVLLGLGERWAGAARSLLRPYLGPGVELEPSRHPPVASWGGGLVAVAVLVPTHELNTSRWSRILTGDWNLFDIWVVVVVALGLIVSFQASFGMLLLARRLGSLGAEVSLDLFDRSRGEPMARFAVRLASMQAIFGVGMGLMSLMGMWAFWPGLGGALTNILASALLLALCTVPYVRSMRALKRSELLRVHGALAGDAAALDASPLASRLRGLNLVELLSYRREVMDAATWPLDAALWGRWILYLVLPPLSWIAAALVEEIVQGAIPG